MAGTTVWAAMGQIPSFSRRKKERKNMSLLDDTLQVKVVGKTHQSPPPGLSSYPCALATLFVSRSSLRSLAGESPTNLPS